VIKVKEAIVADNRQIFSLRLRDQHAVERIAMLSR
jgi:hypothetical protein